MWPLATSKVLRLCRSWKCSIAACRAALAPTRFSSLSLSPSLFVDVYASVLHLCGCLGPELLVNLRDYDYSLVSRPPHCVVAPAQAVLFLSHFLVVPSPKSAATCLPHPRIRSAVHC